MRVRASMPASVASRLLVASRGRDPVPLFHGRAQVGRATSIAWGPTIKKMVGLGSVPAALAAPGTPLFVEWTVEGRRGRVAAAVVDLPFLDLPRKRA